MSFGLSALVRVVRVGYEVGVQMELWSEERGNVTMYAHLLSHVGLKNFFFKLMSHEHI